MSAEPREPHEPRATVRGRWGHWLATRARASLTAGGAWLWNRAWLVGALACTALMLRSVEFSPPQKVRLDERGASSIVGEAQTQAFEADLQNPQAVQVRASLWQLEAKAGQEVALDEDEPEGGRLLSQPVVTTILGMSANIDQTIRLDGGDLTVQMHVEATPRVLVPATKARKGREAKPAVLSLEHRVNVRSRRRQSWGRDDKQLVHLQAQGSLLGLERAPHRVVFEVEGQLFALDLELNAAH